MRDDLTFRFYHKRRESDGIKYDFMLGQESLPYTLKKFRDKLEKLRQRSLTVKPRIIFVGPNRYPDDDISYTEFVLSTFVLEVDTTIFSEKKQEKEIEKFLLEQFESVLS